MPMPPDLPLDALDLAANGAVVERQFPIAGFARLGDRLARSDGTAQVRLELGMIGGTPTGLLRLHAGVVLVCQRCLQPVTREVASEVRLAFASGDDAALPADHDVIPGDPRRVDLATLAEEELLLSLPLIARHEPGEACRLPADVAARAAESIPAAQDLRRPFAGLKDLLKH